MSSHAGAKSGVSKMMDTKNEKCPWQGVQFNQDIAKDIFGTIFWGYGVQFNPKTKHSNQKHYGIGQDFNPKTLLCGNEAADIYKCYYYKYENRCKSGKPGFFI